MEKPLRVKGLAISTGKSRNQNVYTETELQKFSKKLLGAPVFIEHVRAEYAIGKVVKVDWDGRNLWYEALIYDEDWAAKIKTGVIARVSVGYNYQSFDLVDGMMPRDMGDAELSLVALSGIPNASIEPILENTNVGAESWSPPFALTAESGKSETGMDVLKRRKGAEWIADVERQLAAHPITVKYTIWANPENLTKEQLEEVVRDKAGEALGLPLDEVAKERLSHTQLEVVFEREHAHVNEGFVPESMADVRMGDILLNIKRKEDGGKK